MRATSSRVFPTSRYADIRFATERKMSQEISLGTKARSSPGREGAPPSGPKLVLDPEALELGPRGANVEHCLVAKYGRKLLAFFRRRGRSLEEAEDLTQETLVRVFFYETQPSSRIELEACLFHIAQNVFLNDLRARGTHKRSGTEIPLDDDASERPRSVRNTLASPERGALDQLLDAEKRARFRRALDKLPERMRQTLRFVVDQGLRYEETAIVMKVGINTVKTQIHQAKLRLRQLQLPEQFQFPKQDLPFPFLSTSFACLL